MFIPYLFQPVKQLQEKIIEYLKQLLHQSNIVIKEHLKIFLKIVKKTTIVDVNGMVTMLTQNTVQLVNV